MGIISMFLMSRAGGFYVAISIVLIVIIGVSLFVFWPRQRAITVIRDSNDEILYAIFQLGSTFLVKNMINKKFEPVRFKNWNDVVSYIERERAAWN